MSRLPTYGILIYTVFQSSNAIRFETDVTRIAEQPTSLSMANVGKGDCMDIPEDHGLLIVLERDGTCSLQVEPDANWKELHPNIFAPASLEQVTHLYGGGSGVTVFHGLHPTLGSLVMKHGGPKDTKEVFALAVIQQELRKREKHTHDQSAQKMRARIPEFRMIYVSPSHLRNRGAEFWNKLKCAVVLNRYTKESRKNSEPMGSAVELSLQLNRIRLCRTGCEAGVILEERPEKKSLVLGFDDYIDGRFVCGKIQDGYSAISKIVGQLQRLQDIHLWKLTLAQKTIGGPNAINGATLHAKGLLTGDLLNKLAAEFTDVVRCLQALTYEHEKDAVEQVRDELKSIKAACKKEDFSDFSPANLSSTADAFVGHAIKKNYHPISGRFVKLRKFGDWFRDHKLFLSQAEEIPAKHLGILLRQGSRLDQVFLDLPEAGTSGLVSHEFWWHILLKEAVGCTSKAAIQRIWTCGLTDAGIHNMFLSSQFLWLFDLGEPSLMPVPAFLTKFLMSFFHTLGMDDNGEGSWIKRFVIVEDRLALTRETKDVIPKVYNCFLTVLDGLVTNLFDNDLKVKRLLLRYVVIQLLSDCAFCLDRWQSKGGGYEKVDNFDRKLEKWLWRAMWDYYICTDIQGRFAEMLRKD